MSRDFNCEVEGLWKLWEREVVIVEILYVKDYYVESFILGVLMFV